jgi:hypothetical protein
MGLVDKNQCRYCKLKEPQVKIALVKGKPIGECLTCKRNRQLRYRIESKAALGLYKSRPDLVQANLRILSTLFNGTYALVRQSDNSLVGYVIVRNDSIFVSVYNRADLFHYELFGIASYLGDLNTVIAPSRALDGLEVINSNELDGFPLSEVSERLIWYNKALTAKATKLVKSEMKAIRAANMAIARAHRVQKTSSDKT